MLLLISLLMLPVGFFFTQCLFHCQDEFSQVILASGVKNLESCITLSFGVNVGELFQAFLSNILLFC